MRWRWNRNTDTPLPPEEPVGQNPPDGAIIDYTLHSNGGPVSLEIFDSSNHLVRRYSSEDKPDVTEAELEQQLDVPTYWVRRPRTLSGSAGMHRFVWDLRYPPPDALEHEYPIAAIYRDTPREPRGPLVLPGTYTLKLTVAGKTYQQPLTVVMDPRVHTSTEDLEQQLALSMRLVDLMHQDYEAVEQARASGVSSPIRISLEKLNAQLVTVFTVIQGSDNKPTSQAAAAVDELEHTVHEQVAAWNTEKAKR